MSNIRKQKLENILSKGMFHFIIMRGVLLWGLLTGALVSAINYFYLHEPILKSIGFNFIIYPIGGIIFGLIMWYFFKNQYNKLSADEI